MATTIKSIGVDDKSVIKQQQNRPSTNPQNVSNTPPPNCPANDNQPPPPSPQLNLEPVTLQCQSQGVQQNPMSILPSYELIYDSLDGLKTELDQYVGDSEDSGRPNNIVSLMDELMDGPPQIQPQPDQHHQQSATIMNQENYAGYNQQHQNEIGATPKRELTEYDVFHPTRISYSNTSSILSQDFSSSEAPDPDPVRRQEQEKQPLMMSSNFVVGGGLTVKVTSVEAAENIQWTTSFDENNLSFSAAAATGTGLQNQSIAFSPWDDNSSLLDFATASSPATFDNNSTMAELTPSVNMFSVISPTKCTVISQGNVASLQTMEADRVIQQSIDTLQLSQQQHHGDGRDLVWSPIVVDGNGQKNSFSSHNSSYNSGSTIDPASLSGDSGFGSERNKSISHLVAGAESEDADADYFPESAIEEYSDEGEGASDDGEIDIVTRKPLKKKKKRGRKPKTGAADSSKQKTTKSTTRKRAVKSNDGDETNNGPPKAAKRPRKEKNAEARKPLKPSKAKAAAILSKQTTEGKDGDDGDVPMDMNETVESSQMKNDQLSRKSLGKALRPEFEINCNPDQIRMEELADVHGYSYVQVQRWFQARRSQYKIRTRRESMLPPATLAMLEEEFKWDPWLESNRVVQLAKKLDLARDQVTGWFARKRKNLIKSGVKVEPRPKQIGGKRGAVSRTGSLTTEQRMIMEFEFQVNPWPYSNEINRIANDVELDRQQVYFWFKNKRRGQSSLHLGSVPVNEHVIAFRHTRRPITAAQLAVLEEEWVKGEKPSPERIEELSQQLLLTEKKIFNWFRGRRCRDRKRECERLGLKRVPRDLKIAAHKRSQSDTSSASFGEPMKEEEDYTEEEEDDASGDEQQEEELEENQHGISMDFSTSSKKVAIAGESSNAPGSIKLILKKDKNHKGDYKLVK